MPSALLGIKRSQSQNLQPAPIGQGNGHRIPAVRRKDVVESCEVHSGLGHQGGEPGDEIQWLKNHMGGAIPIGCLEFIAHPAVSC